MKRRHLLTVAAGSALSSLPLARPALAQGSGNPRVLRFVPQADLANPDPVWSTTTVAAMHAYHGVGQAVWPGREASCRRSRWWAAQEVCADGLTWTLTLRDGLMHHDGEKVRAADASPRSCAGPSARRMVETLMERTNELIALDDNRLRFRLKKRFALLPYALSGLSIMPERIAKTDAFTQISEYVGSGPYKFVRDEWKAGAGAAMSATRNTCRAASPEHVGRRQGGQFRPRRMDHHARPRHRRGGVAARRDRLAGRAAHRPGAAAAQSAGVKVDLFDTLGNLMSMFFNHVPAAVRQREAAPRRAGRGGPAGFRRCGAGRPGEGTGRRRGGRVHRRNRPMPARRGWR